MEEPGSLLLVLQTGSAALKPNFHLMTEEKIRNSQAGRSRKAQCEELDLCTGAARHRPGHTRGLRITQELGWGD